MMNRKLNQHEAQTTGLGVMIGWCILVSQHVGSNRQLANVSCSSFRYTNDSFFRCTNDEQIDHLNQRPQRRKWTREDNKLALHSYFRSIPAKRGNRKIMIEIWAEFDRFKVTNQRLDYKIRTITKNSWFYDLETLEIHQQIYRKIHQQTPNIVTETINTRKPETSNQTLHDNDRYTTNTQTQILTQKEKMNVDIIKRIMPEKKTTLPSHWKEKMKTVKSETEKVNYLSTNISTNDIMELNDLIYAGAKLDREKSGSA